MFYQIERLDLLKHFKKFMDMEKGNKRRGFLKILLAAGASIGLLSSFKKSSTNKNTEKIKMLTPDGKLVEVDKSMIEKEITTNRASNKEVLEWINSKPTNN